MYVLHYKDPLKVVIYESDPTLSDSVPSKLIYLLSSLMTHTMRTKASLIIIPSASTVLEITKCFSYFTSIQAESIMVL